MPIALDRRPDKLLLENDVGQLAQVEPRRIVRKELFEKGVDGVIVLLLDVKEFKVDVDEVLLECCELSRSVDGEEKLTSGPWTSSSDMSSAFLRRFVAIAGRGALVGRCAKFWVKKGPRSPLPKLATW